MTKLVMLYDWRQAIVIDGILGVFITLCIAIFVKDPPFEKEPTTPMTLQHSLLASLKLAYGNIQNVLAGLYASLMNMPVAILGAFVGSVYLMESRHYLRTDAAEINSMIFMGTIIGGPLLGYLSDKIRLRKMPMIICTMLSVLIVFLVLYLPNISVGHMELLFFLLGLFSSAQVLTYPLVSENNCMSMTATAVSVVSMLTQGGFILYQNLFSYLLEESGQQLVHHSVYAANSYRHALMLIPYGFIIALISVFLLKETFGKRIEDRVA